MPVSLFPWELASDGVRIFTFSDARTPSPDVTFRTNYILATCLNPEVARRILAAVNATKDVTTEGLEAIVKADKTLNLALVLGLMMKREGVEL